MPSAAALSLAQYAMQSNDPLVTSITFGLLQNAIVLQDIPIITKSSLIVNGVRWTGALPTVNWVPLNTDPAVTSGTPSTYQEQAYIVRNAIDVDRWLLKDQNQIQDPRQVQLAGWLKAFAYDFNDKFINNVAVTGDQNAPVGVRNRLDNPVQYGAKIYGGTTTTGIAIFTNGKSEAFIGAGGTTAGIGPTNLTTTTAQKFLVDLETLLWSVDAPDGTNVILYMNDITIRYFQAALRIMGSSALNITRDNFDRAVTHYKNAVIRDIGYKADQATRIIGTVETAAGLITGGTNLTSIYAVRADTDHFFGWQMDTLAAQDIGLVGNGGATYRIVIDWACGLLQVHPRAIGRLYNIDIS